MSIKNNEITNMSIETFKSDMFEKIIGLINDSKTSTRTICERCDIEHDELIRLLNGTNLDILLLYKLVDHLGYELVIGFKPKGDNYER